MKDQYGRNINYMRISLTDRCNLHCRYCMPEQPVHLQHEDILSYEELLRISSCAVSLGITSFKITGGEPLVRKEAVGFIRRLKELPGVQEVTLTTNGILLTEYIKELRQIGLDGVNISLDTMDRALYEKLTGMDALELVKKSIQCACDSGLKVKLNTVLIPENDLQGILELMELIRKQKTALRLIEVMPMKGNENNGMSGREVRAELEKAGIRLHQADVSGYGNGPSVYYSAEGYQGLLGFIEPIHGKFCSSCNRIRLTAAGEIKPCLYYPDTVSLREKLRRGADEEQIRELMDQAVYRKPGAHAFETGPACRAMNEIGG